MWWREHEEHTEMVREIVKKMVGIKQRPISSLPLFRWARMQKLKMLAKKNVNRFRVQILLNWATVRCPLRQQQRDGGTG